MIKKIIRRIKKIISVLDYATKINSKDFVLIDTPTHGNLGDQAIALAQTQIVKSYYEVTADNFNKLAWLYAKFTPHDKVVIIPGGGFVGSLWPIEEERIHKILSTFSKNKVIIFPQTVYFDLETNSGLDFFNKSKQFYEQHKNLTFFVRDNKSYEFLLKNMSNVDARISPDIVLLLKYENAISEDRSGILLCLRDDIERVLSEDDYEEINESIVARCGTIDIKTTSMVCDLYIPPENRKREVYKKLDEFSKAKLVVTDRLHAMIFSAITATPCIAFGNMSGKVKGVYSWISYLPYIKYVNNIAEFKDTLREIDIESTYFYDATHIKESSQQLMNIVN